MNGSGVILCQLSSFQRESRANTMDFLFEGEGRTTLVDPVHGSVELEAIVARSIDGNFFMAALQAFLEMLQKAAIVFHETRIARNKVDQESLVAVDVSRTELDFVLQACIDWHDGIGFGLSPWVADGRPVLVLPT